MNLFYLPLLFLILNIHFAEAKTVRYELAATQSSVNLSGKKWVDFAIQINGSIPAPTLEFTEGDDAEILVMNGLKDQEISLHWHGILLPPEQDGVAYINTPPIFPGKEHLFKFKIRQHGTYWYHSHTNVQEQKGVYGAIVIHPKTPSIHADRDRVVILSDWSDENADQILKNLRKDGDYYLQKKGTVRSWLGAFQNQGVGTYLKDQWNRMGGMDFSDVGYDAFLINGQRDSQLLTAKAGDIIRLRIINASASTYFQVALGQSHLKVISADGIDISPTHASSILLGMAETYDVLFKLPESKNYELKATAQDGTGSASTWIGAGDKVPAPSMPTPALYAEMDHSEMQATSEHSAHGGHTMAAGPLTVDRLKAQKPTAFMSKNPLHDLKLVLGGDMERYVWHINGKVMSQDRSIFVKEGEVIQFTFVNETMMHHPMHLHGHFFRVLNSNGDFSPLKHTVDVPPHGKRTIQFLANEPGEWMLHCHNLYHMKNGMARTVRYMSYTPSPEIAHLEHQDPHHHDNWYTYGLFELSTHHSSTFLRATQTWNQLEFRAEARNTTPHAFSFHDPWEFEGDFFYRRWMGTYSNLIFGGSSFDKVEALTVGIGAILPLLIDVNALITQHGKFRIDLEKKIQWTSTLFTHLDFTWRPDQARNLGHDTEFEITLMYSPKWTWAAGLMYTNTNLGAGIQIQM